MRLRRLHLTPYGRFADRVLDFGPARAGADVTVIYGPNEAGKSTSFAAWLDFLFGIPNQTPYSFRHPRSTLAIGAEIEADGVVHSFRRTGARKASLTDADGREVAQHRLDALLHGLDRESYRSRFSLDEAVLREGGEAILAAKGDLGEVLYAGTSGLSGLSAVLAEVAGEVEAVRRKGARGSTTELTRVKGELSALESALKDARLDPRRAERLRAGTEAAAQAYADAEEGLKQARAAVALHAAAEGRAALRREGEAGRAALADMPGGPDLPPDAAPRAAGLGEALRGGAAALAKAQAARDAAVAVLEKTEADPEGLRLAAEIAALDALRAEDDAPLIACADDAARMLPRLERDLAAAREALAETVAGVAPEGTAPEAAALPDDGIEALEAALKTWRARRGARASARRERDDARAAVGAPVPPPESADALRTARRVRDDARRADAAGLREAATAARAAAQRAAAGLPRGWRALAEGQGGLPEEETVLAAVRAVEKSDGAVEGAGERLAEAAEDLARARDDRDTLAARDDHVGEDALAESRRARDAAWSAHRAALDEGSATAFERSMHADDAIRQAHADGTTLREQVRQAGEAVARADARMLRRRAALDTAEAAARAARDGIAPLAAALGLGPADPPAALRPRLAALRAALEAALDAGEADRRAQAAETALALAEAGLRAALGADAAGDPALLDGMAEAREAALETARAAHEVWRLASEAAEKRETALAETETALVRAEEAIRRLVAGSPYADTPVATLDTLHPTLRKLTREAGEVAGACNRVARLRRAREAFEEAAARLRAMTGSDAPPAALMEAARGRAGDAIIARDTIAGATGAREAAERDRAEARAGLDAAQAGRAALLEGQEAPGDDPDALIARLLDRDALRARLAALEAEIDALGNGQDAQALAREEAALAPGRGAMLADRVRVAETAKDDAVAAHALADKAEKDARAGQGGADIDQDRAALLAELRESVRAAAARMIGLRAARAGLDRLRRSRRGPMLERTQDAFIRMTGGEWTALETRPEGAGERLVARRGEEIVTAEGMSQGTRAQLYLSLRLAGYGMFCAEHGPLPFVTDDVLETFDDARAAVALDLTEELGRQGQAIFLTHHRHLAEMARERIAGVHVIDLEDDARA